MHIVEIIKPWIDYTPWVSFHELARRLNKKIPTRLGKQWTQRNLQRVYDTYESYFPKKKIKKKPRGAKKRSFKQIIKDGKININENEEQQQDSDTDNDSQNGNDILLLE